MQIKNIHKYQSKVELQNRGMIASDQEDAEAGGSEMFIVSKGLAKPLSELREYFQENSPSMARDLVDEGTD